jgi:hypothetical protein
VSSLLIVIVLGTMAIQVAESEEATGPTAIGMAFFLFFLIMTFSASFLLNLIVVLILLIRNQL